VSVHLLVPPPLAAGSLTIAGDDHHYLFRARRLAVGDRLVVFDGAGLEADAAVAAVDGTAATLEVAPPRPQHRVGPALVSLVPLIKGDRMDLALEKLVELGVTTIAPFAAARSVVRLDAARAAERHRRYQAIVRAAAQQCRTATLPTVAPIGDLTAALARAAGCPLRLVLSEQAGAPPLAGALPTTPPAGVALLSGPEGGLDDAEQAAAVAAGFLPVSLGPRVLRAETAAIAALAAVGFAIGDLGVAVFDSDGSGAV
jgi:16S rRNA (uracil1498-N3)-methyltransferase